MEWNEPGATSPLLDIFSASPHPEAALGSLCILSNCPQNRMFLAGVLPVFLKYTIAEKKVPILALPGMLSTPSQARSSRCALFLASVTLSSAALAALVAASAACLLAQYILIV